MRPLRLCVLVPLVGLILLPGCNIVGALAYFLSPPQIQKTEFELTAGRLAILIETTQPGEDNPVFTKALHEKLAQLFRDEKINDNIVPRTELLKLRQANPDFERWSLQKIGRSVGAVQVLYLRLESLRMRAGPDHPLLQPQVRLRMKVIDVNATSGEARLWPAGREERQGREVKCGRPPREAGDVVAIDTEAAKLAKDTAHHVAMPFHDVDMEEALPREP